MSFFGFGMTQTKGRKETSTSKEKRDQSLLTIEYFHFRTALRLQNTFSGKCYQRKYLEHICWRAGGGGTTFAEQTEIYKHLNLEKIVTFPHNFGKLFLKNTQKLAAEF